VSKYSAQIEKIYKEARKLARRLKRSGEVPPDCFAQVGEKYKKRSIFLK